MYTDHIKKAFKEIGVEFRAVEREPNRFRRDEPDSRVTIDTRGNKRSAFVLSIGKDTEGEIKLLNVNSSQKGVLLQVNQEDEKEHHNQVGDRAYAIDRRTNTQR